MKKRQKKIFLFALLIMLSMLGFTQENSPQTINEFFQDSMNFSYLNGLEEKIQKAAMVKDVNSLCVYSSLLAYVEKVTQKTHPKYSGESLLKDATEMAWDRESVDELRMVQKVWESKIFGFANTEASEAIVKYIQELEKRNLLRQEKKDLEDMEEFALSLSKEYAKIDAVEQISEKIFGLLIVFSTDVRSLLEKKDVITQSLQKNLLVEANFSDFEEKDTQIVVVAQVSIKQVLAAIQSLDIEELFDIQKITDYSKNLSKVFTATGASDLL